MAPLHWQSKVLQNMEADFVVITVHLMCFMFYERDTRVLTDIYIIYNQGRQEFLVLLYALLYVVYRKRYFPHNLLVLADPLAYL